MRIVLAGLAASLLLAATAQASFPGRNGSIAHPWFCWDEGCPIFFLSTGNPATPSILLPSAPYPNELQPDNLAWSPDGKRLAFDGRATSLGTGRAIYVVNADGTGLKQVGRGDKLRYNPAWSPDGNVLAFTQDNGAAGSGDVYTITTTGGSLTRLTTSGAWEGAADWAPDGSRIAYICVSGSRTHICQMTPKGESKSNTTAALNLGGSTSEPSWSPNSQRLTFSARRPELGDRVYTMTRTGGSLRDITPVDGEGRRNGENPSWSPDGARIAFEQTCLGGPCGGIRTVKLDGTDPRWVGQSEDFLYLDPGAWQALR